MEDLLSMNMDQINDVLKTQHKKNHGRFIDPLDHYEVESHALQILFTTEDFREASIVFVQVNSSCKAIIRVQGTMRKVLLTNAPYQYPILTTKQLDPSEKVRRHVIES